MYCDLCHRAYPGALCPTHGEPEALTGRRLSLPGVQPTFLAGRVLGGRYTIRGLLGRGGMGGVYLAADAETGSYCAVKRLESHHTDEAAYRARFLREAEILSRIDHSHVVKVLGAGEDDEGTPFVAIELLVGESLQSYLKRSGPLDPAFAIRIFRRVASGLEAAHRVGIIHRDVKPGNMFLVGEPGAPSNVKVLDFGLAKLDVGGHITASGIAVGTMDYIAPEQLLAEAIDPRADVYALGIVLFRALTGKHPFDARDDQLMLAHHLVRPLPAPTSIRPELDPRLEAIILTATRKVPANRYPDMAALGEDLERLMGVRFGSITARSAIEEEDVYVPTSRVGKLASAYFYRRLGLGTPAWATPEALASAGE